MIKTYLNTLKFNKVFHMIFMYFNNVLVKFLKRLYIMMKDKIKTQTKIFIYVDKVLKTKSKNGVLYKSKYKIYRNVVFYSGKHI